MKNFLKDCFANIRIKRSDGTGRMDSAQWNQEELNWKTDMMKGKQK